MDIEMGTTNWGSAVRQGKIEQKSKRKMKWKLAVIGHMAASRKSRKGKTMDGSILPLGFAM